MIRPPSLHQTSTTFGNSAITEGQVNGRVPQPIPEVWASALLSAAADRAASQAERLLVKLLRAAGITGWELGYTWCGHVIDVAFPALRIAIEADGWAWHVTPERFVHDRQRQNAMVNGQWHVLRFTWHDLPDRPAAVITEIRDAFISR